MTAWEERVAGYLRLRRQLGFKLDWHEHVLGELAEHLDGAGVDALTVQAAIGWAGLPREDGRVPGRSRATARMNAARPFAAYLHALDPVHEVPPRGVFGHQPRRRPPYIYSPGEVRALLDVAGRLQRYQRGRIFPVAFGLLAATGLRVGEALALDLDEVDLDQGVITVTRGKSRDPRLVPVHDTTMAALTDYADWRRHLVQPGTGDANAFLLDHSGRRLSYFNTQYAFKKARADAGLDDRRPLPRIHDLRHTFAVATLLGWYRDGVDAAAMLPRLSTYLGHTNPANTYWYLTAVPGLLAHAADRLDPSWPATSNGPRS
jgi:integrase